ncbi:MAG: hypothetical protein AAF483_19410 [Planctomycetota bacterium]
MALDAPPTDQQNWKTPQFGTVVLGMIALSFSSACHLNNLWQIPYLRFLVVLPVFAAAIFFQVKRGDAVRTSRNRKRAINTLLILTAGIALAGESYGLLWPSFFAFVSFFFTGLLCLVRTRAWWSIAAGCSPLFVACLLPSAPEYDGHLLIEKTSIDGTGILLDTVGIANLVQQGELTFREGMISPNLLTRLLINPYFLLSLYCFFLAISGEKALNAVSTLAFIFPCVWFVNVIHGTTGTWLRHSYEFNIFADGLSSQVVSVFCFGAILGLTFAAQRGFRIIWKPFKVESFSTESMHFRLYGLLIFPEKNRNGAFEGEISNWQTTSSDLGLCSLASVLLLIAGSLSLVL